MPTGRRRDPPGPRGRPGLRAPERRSRHRAVPGGGQGRLAAAGAHRSGDRAAACAAAWAAGRTRLRARHPALVRWRGRAGDHANRRPAGEAVELLEASDEDGAQQFADSVAAGTPRSKTYRDDQVQVDHRGLATALVGGFLAIGTERGVRDVIDADSGAKGTGSLADDPDASAARAALPDERLADAYLSKGGIAQLVANSDGPLATLGLVINPGASEGAAVALVADDDGLEVEIRSELDPDRTKAHPGFFSAFPAFEPTLAASLPAALARVRGFRGSRQDAEIAAEAGERRAAGAGGGGRRPAQPGEGSGRCRSGEGPPALARQRGGVRSAARAAATAARPEAAARARSCPARRRRSSSSSRATSTPSGRARRWPAWRTRSPRRSTPPSGSRLPRSASTRSVT